MSIRSYKELIVWQKSMDLAELIYDCTKEFPLDERYGLVSQMRRAAMSIPSNIAEGSRRSSRKDFRHFVLIAYGSGSELETQLEMARRKHMANDMLIKRCDLLLEQVMKMLNKLQSTLHIPTP